MNVKQGNSGETQVKFLETAAKPYSQENPIKPLQNPQNHCKTPRNHTKPYETPRNLHKTLRNHMTMNCFMNLYLS